MNTSSSQTNIFSKEKGTKASSSALDHSPDSDKFKDYCEKLSEYILTSQLEKENKDKIKDVNNNNNKETNKDKVLLDYLRYINLSTSKTKYQMKILDLGLIQKVLIPLMHLNAKKNSEIPKECCKIFINVSRNKNNHYKLSPEDFIFKELFSLISIYLNSEVITDILNILLYLSENRDFLSKLSMHQTFIKKSNSDEVNFLNQNLAHHGSSNISLASFVVEVNVGTILRILIEKYLDDLNSGNKNLLLKIIFNLFNFNNNLMHKDSVEPIIRCLGDKEEECIISALRIIYIFSQKIENNFEIIKSNFLFRIFRIYKYANLEINKILVKIILNIFTKEEYIDMFFKNNIILILENLFGSFEADQNEETVTTVFEIFKKSIDRLEKDLLFKLFSRALNFAQNSKNEVFVQSCLSTVDAVLKKNSKFILGKQSNKDNIFESMHAFFKFKNFMIVQYSLSIFEIVLRKNFREFKKNYVASNEKSLSVKTLIHHVINLINEFSQQEIVIKACKILKMLSKIPLLHNYFLSEPQITIIRLFNEDIINKKNKILKEIHAKKTVIAPKSYSPRAKRIDDETTDYIGSNVLKLKNGDLNDEGYIGIRSGFAGNSVHAVKKSYDFANFHSSNSNNNNNNSNFRNNFFGKIFAGNNGSANNDYDSNSTNNFNNRNNNNNNYNSNRNRNNLDSLIEENVKEDETFTNYNLNNKNSNNNLNSNYRDINSVSMSPRSPVSPDVKKPYKNSNFFDFANSSKAKTPMFNKSNKNLILLNLNNTTNNQINEDSITNRNLNNNNINNNNSNFGINNNDSEAKNSKKNTKNSVFSPDNTYSNSNGNNNQSNNIFTARSHGNNNNNANNNNQKENFLSPLNNSMNQNSLNQQKNKNKKSVFNNSSNNNNNNFTSINNLNNKNINTGNKFGVNIQNNITDKVSNLASTHYTFDPSNPNNSKNPYNSHNTFTTQKQDFPKTFSTPQLQKRFGGRVPYNRERGGGASKKSLSKTEIDKNNYFLKRFYDLEQLNDKLKLSIEILANLTKYSENLDTLTNKGFLEIINKMLIEENKDALSTIVKCVRGFCLSSKSIEIILSCGMLDKILQILKTCDRASKIEIFNHFRNILESDIKLQKQFIIELGISTIMGEVTEKDDELNNVILRALYVISSNVNKLFIVYYNSQRDFDQMDYSDDSESSFSKISEEEKASSDAEKKQTLLPYKLKIQYIDSDANSNKNGVGSKVNDKKKSLLGYSPNDNYNNRRSKGNNTQRKSSGNENHIINNLFNLNAYKNNNNDNNLIQLDALNSNRDLKGFDQEASERKISNLTDNLSENILSNNLLPNKNLEKTEENSTAFGKKNSFDNNNKIPNVINNNKIYGDFPSDFLKKNFINNNPNNNINNNQNNEDSEYNSIKLISKTNNQNNTNNNPALTLNNISNQNIYGTNINNISNYNKINKLNSINSNSKSNNNNLSVPEKWALARKVSKSIKTIKSITGSSSKANTSRAIAEEAPGAPGQTGIFQGNTGYYSKMNLQLQIFKHQLSRKTMMNKLLNIGGLPSTSLETHKELIKILINLYLNRYYLKYFTRDSVFANIMKIVEIIMKKSKNDEKESEMIKLLLIFLKFICEEENLIRKFLDTTVISDIIHIINKNEYISSIQNNLELEEFHYNLSLVLLRLSEFRSQSAKLVFLNKKFSVLEKLFELNLFNGKIYIVNVIKNIVTEKKDFFLEEDILRFINILINCQNSLLIYDTIDLLGILIFNRNLCKKMRNVFNFLISEIKSANYSTKFKNRILEIILCLSYEKENIKGFLLSDFLHLFKILEISINKKVTLLILMNFSTIPTNFSYLTAVPGALRNDINTGEVLNDEENLSSTERFFEKVDGNLISKNDIFNIINDLLDSDKFSQILIQRFLINVTSIENIDYSIISQKVIDVLLEIVISNRNMQDRVVIFALAILVNLSNRNVIKIKNSCLTENFLQQSLMIDSNHKKTESSYKKMNSFNKFNRSLKSSKTLKSGGNISMKDLKENDKVPKSISRRMSIGTSSPIKNLIDKKNLENNNENEDENDEKYGSSVNINIYKRKMQEIKENEEDNHEGNDTMEFGRRADLSEKEFENNENKENSKAEKINENNNNNKNPINRNKDENSLGQRIYTKQDTFNYLNNENNLENQNSNLIIIQEYQKNKQQQSQNKTESEYFDLHIIDFILLRIYNIIDTMNDLFCRKNMDIVSLAIMLACNLARKLMTSSNGLDDQISKCIQAFVLKEENSKIDILEFDSGKFFLIAVIKYCVCLSCDEKKVLNFLQLFEYILNKFLNDEKLKNIKLQKEDFLNNSINFNLMESYLKFLNIMIESEQLYEIFKSYFKEDVLNFYSEFIRAFSEILNDSAMDQHFAPDSNFQELTIIVLQILSTFMKINNYNTEKLNKHVNRIIMKLIQFDPKKYDDQLKSLFIYVLCNLIESSKKRKKKKEEQQQSKFGNKLEIDENYVNNYDFNNQKSILEKNEIDLSVKEKNLIYDNLYNNVNYKKADCEEEQEKIDFESNPQLKKWLIDLFKIESNSNYVDYYCLKMFLKNLKEENYCTVIWKSKSILKKLSKFLKDDNILSSKSNLLNDTYETLPDENFMRDLIKKIVNYISFDVNSHINLIGSGLYEDFKQMLFKKFSPLENEKISKDDVIILVNIFLNRENLNYLWEDMLNIMKIIFVCPEIIISIKIKLLDIFIHWNLFNKEFKTFSEDYLVIFELIYNNLSDNNFSDMIFLVEYFATKYDEVSGRIIQNSKIIQKIYQDFLIFDESFPSKLDEFYSFIKIIEKIIEQFDLNNSQINLNNLNGWNSKMLQAQNLGVALLIPENLIADLVLQINKNKNSECLKDLTFLNSILNVLFSYLNKLKNFSNHKNYEFSNKNINKISFAKELNDEEKMDLFLNKIDLNTLIGIAMGNALELVQARKVMYLENKEKKRQIKLMMIMMKNEKDVNDNIKNENSKNTLDDFYKNDVRDDKNVKYNLNINNGTLSNYEAKKANEKDVNFNLRVDKTNSNADFDNKSFFDSKQVSKENIEKVDFINNNNINNLISSQGQGNNELLFIETPINDIKKYKTSLRVIKLEPEKATDAEGIESNKKSQSNNDLKRVNKDYKKRNTNAVHNTNNNINLIEKKKSNLSTFNNNNYNFNNSDLNSDNKNKYQEKNKGESNLNNLRIDNISEINKSHSNNINVNPLINLGDENPKKLIKLKKLSLARIGEIIDLKTEKEKERLRNLIIDPVNSANNNMNNIETKFNNNGNHNKDNLDSIKKYLNEADNFSNKSNKDLNINNFNNENNIYNTNYNGGVENFNDLNYLQNLNTPEIKSSVNNNNKNNLNYSQHLFLEESNPQKLLEDLNPDSYIKSKSFVYLILRFFISEENKTIAKTLIKQNNFLFSKDCFDKLTSALIDRDEFEKRFTELNIKISSKNVLSVNSSNEDVNEKDVENLEEEIFEFLKSFEINDLMFLLIFYANVNLLKKIQIFDYVADYFIKIFNIIINKLIISYNLHVKNQKIFSNLKAKNNASQLTYQSKTKNFKSDFSSKSGDGESIVLSNNNEKNYEIKETNNTNINNENREENERLNDDKDNVDENERGMEDDINNEKAEQKTHKKKHLKTKRRKSKFINENNISGENLIFVTDAQEEISQIDSKDLDKKELSANNNNINYNNINNRKKSKEQNEKEQLDKANKRKSNLEKNMNNLLENNENNPSPKKPSFKINTPNPTNDDNFNINLKAEKSSRMHSANKSHLKLNKQKNPNTESVNNELNNIDDPNNINTNINLESNKNKLYVKSSSIKATSVKFIEKSEEENIITNKNNETICPAINNSKISKQKSKSDHSIINNNANKPERPLSIKKISALNPDMKRGSQVLGLEESPIDEERIKEKNLLNLSISLAKSKHSQPKNKYAETGKATDKSMQAEISKRNDNEIENDENENLSFEKFKLIKSKIDDIAEAQGRFHVLESRKELKSKKSDEDPLEEINFKHKNENKFEKKNSDASSNFSDSNKEKNSNEVSVIDLIEDIKKNKEKDAIKNSAQTRNKAQSSLYKEEAAEGNETEKIKNADSCETMHENSKDGLIPNAKEASNKSLKIPSFSNSNKNNMDNSKIITIYNNNNLKNHSQLEEQKHENHVILNEDKTQYKNKNEPNNKNNNNIYNNENNDELNSTQTHKFNKHNKGSFKTKSSEKNSIVNFNPSSKVNKNYQKVITNSSFPDDINILKNFIGLKSKLNETNINNNNNNNGVQDDFMPSYNSIIKKTLSAYFYLCDFLYEHCENQTVIFEILKSLINIISNLKINNELKEILIRFFQEFLTKFKIKNPQDLSILITFFVKIHFDPAICFIKKIVLECILLNIDQRLFEENLDSILEITEMIIPAHEFNKDSVFVFLKFAKQIYLMITTNKNDKAQLEKVKRFTLKVIENHLPQMEEEMKHKFKKIISKIEFMQRKDDDHEEEENGSYKIKFLNEIKF